MSDEALPDLRVYPRHIQQLGYCLVPGAREWARQHNVDWRKFIHEGLAFSEVTVQDAFWEEAKTKAIEEYRNGIDNRV